MDSAASMPPWIPTSASVSSPRGHQAQSSISSQNSTETVTTPPATSDEMFFFDDISPASSESSYGSLGEDMVHTDESDGLSPFSGKSLFPDGADNSTPRIEEPHDPMDTTETQGEAALPSKRQNPGLALDLSSIKSALPLSVRCPAAPRIGCLPSPAFSAFSEDSDVDSLDISHGPPSRPHPVSRFSDDTLVTSSSNGSTPRDMASDQSPLSAISSPVDPDSPTNPVIVVAPPPSSDVDAAADEELSAIPVKKPKGYRPPRLNLSVVNQDPLSQSEPITPRTMGALESFGVQPEQDAELPPTRRLRSCRSFPVEGAGPRLSSSKRPRSPLAGPALGFGASKKDDTSIASSDQTDTLSEYRRALQLPSSPPVQNAKPPMKLGSPAGSPIAV